jgi:hypothetical protein
VCQRSGDVVQLEGLCTNVLKCARVSYTVNGAPATSFTCPSAGSSATIVPSINDFGGHPDCDYPGPRIVVDCARRAAAGRS